MRRGGGWVDPKGDEIAGLADHFHADDPVPAEADNVGRLHHAVRREDCARQAIDDRDLSQFGSTCEDAGDRVGSADTRAQQRGAGVGVGPRVDDGGSIRLNFAPGVRPARGLSGHQPARL